MKCGYQHCKYGGEVDKDDAIKISSRYWHKECNDERNIKGRILIEFYKKFSNSKEPEQSAKGAISKYIHKLGYDAEYVLFCLLIKAKNLNSMHGLIYTLNDSKNLKEYKEKKAKHTNIEKYQHNSKANENVVTINKKTNKKWGDYFE